jgi:hypothetical protein
MKMGASTPLLLAALRAPGCMIAGAERAAGRRFEQVIDGEGKFRLERADTGWERSVGTWTVSSSPVYLALSEKAYSNVPLPGLFPDYWLRIPVFDPAR